MPSVKALRLRSSLSFVRGLIFGNDVTIHPHVIIEPGVHIEDGVEIFPGAYLGKEPKGVGTTLRAVTFERHLRIGRGSSIGPNAVIFYDVEIGAETLIGDGASIREQCRIGTHCLISRYVTINFNTMIGDRARIMDSTHITGNCVIGNNVFISTLVATVNDNEMICAHTRKARLSALASLIMPASVRERACFPEYSWGRGPSSVRGQW